MKRYCGFGTLNNYNLWFYTKESKNILSFIKKAKLDLELGMYMMTSL